MAVFVFKFVRAIEFSMCCLPGALSMASGCLDANAKLSKDLRPLVWSSAMETMCCSGVEALYVHIMAVNEGAKLFYELHGFTVEQEESSNQAHYR